jgi:hypothetical protein
MNTMNMFINFALFQVAWFACVLGAAHGVPWLGPLVVTAVVAYHLRRVPEPRTEMMLLMLAALTGLVFDSLLVSAGWLTYPAGQWHPLLAPYWIVAMWIGFATTLNVSMAWLKGRSYLAFVLGAFGGPLAYLGGAKLGGVSFTDTTAALAALAMGWALIMPLLMLAAQQLEKRRPAAERRVLTTAAESQGHA